MLNQKCPRCKKGKLIQINYPISAISLNKKRSEDRCDRCLTSFNLTYYTQAEYIRVSGGD